eukprot:997278-Pyramimonas_sp.AAC.1
MAHLGSLLEDVPAGGVEIETLRRERAVRPLVRSGIVVRQDTRHRRQSHDDRIWVRQLTRGHPLRE